MVTACTAGSTGPSCIAVSAAAVLAMSTYPPPLKDTAYAMAFCASMIDRARAEGAPPPLPPLPLLLLEVEVEWLAMKPELLALAL